MNFQQQIETDETAKDKKHWLLIGGLGLLTLAFLWGKKGKSQVNPAVLRWRELVEKNKNRKIPTSLVLAIIHVESGGIAGYISRDGSRYGLMGVPIYISGDYRESENISLPPSGVSLLDPSENIKFGTDFLFWLFQRVGQYMPTQPIDDFLEGEVWIGDYYNVDVKYGLGFYNQGKISYDSQGSLTSQKYISEVWKLWNLYSETIYK